MAYGRRARAAGLISLCLLALVSCSTTPDDNSATRADVQALLDRRATAVLAHTGFPAVRALPLAQWSYEVTAVHPDGDTATADAELSYRVAGYDAAPVTAARTVTLARDAQGAWGITGEAPGEKAGQQLWDQGTVSAVKGAHSLVLGAGQPEEKLREFADLADKAVPAVTAEWGADWVQHVVVLVPGSLAGMAGLLGSPKDNYRGIAAVTTGETGAGTKAPADRIVVNPDAYGLLGPVGRQVVLTHETTHVATRAHTDAATPLWLSEGYADWIGYHDTGRTPVEAAPELRAAVLDGRVPSALPTDEDFAFTGDATRLAQAYEGGWLACRMIADEWGEGKLNEFYRAVGAHERRAGAVEGALGSVLGMTEEEFTGRWRTYVKTELEAP